MTYTKDPTVYIFHSEVHSLISLDGRHHKLETIQGRSLDGERYLK